MDRNHEWGSIKSDFILKKSKSVFHVDIIQTFNERHLHVFCDASVQAHGAAAYVAIDECQKARVAPLKKRMLPR